MAGIVVGDACTAPNEQTLVINGVFPPASLSAGGTSGCGAGSTQIASGLLDVTLAQSVSTGYLLFPSVLNKQISNASFNRGIETNQIIIDTARVDITLNNATAAGAPPNDLSFDETIYAYIRPEESAAVPVELLPADLVKHLTVSGNAYAQVSLQFIGQSNNNTIKSNTMKFTVNLCAGCLIHQVGACCAAAMNLGLCNPGQDAPVDCCTNGSGATVCPAAIVAGSPCATTDAGP